jgi:cell division protein FtsW (lipid II flippase)
MAMLRRMRQPAFASRPVELRLLLVVSALALLGFTLVTAAAQVRAGADPWPALPQALWPPALVVLPLLAVHILLRARGTTQEQLILPVVGLLAVLGFVMIWRLRPAEAAWQQLFRGWLPGMALVALLVARPVLVERIRRDWPLLISLAGLVLLLLTAFFGVLDESGARLSLRVGPLPPVQTSELVKLALIVFLAWYIESEGERAEARATQIGWARLPALSYFLPGVLYASVATLALVRMSDFGAILILACIFLAMFYAGFEPRVFLPILGIGLVVSAVALLVVIRLDGVPEVVQQRWQAYLNPWSRAPLLASGQPTGLTIAEGPGYQVQQGIYALLAGGVSGTGLGFGLPHYVPLAHSDMIFAAVAEELGVMGALAMLGLFAILLLRVLRLGLELPRQQVFERLLAAGIGVHLFIQMFVMAGGTLNLLPLTGITIPFVSQGGVALLVNVVEVGLILALAQRLEGRPA